MWRTKAGEIVGAAIVGRPVSRQLDDGWTVEVTRVAVEDGHPNACSMLYGACWRAARAMGYRRAVTYTLRSERGTSVRGAGWKCIGETGGGSWSRERRPRIDLHPIQGQAAVGNLGLMLDGRQVLDNALSERAFQRQVAELAELTGWRVYHTYDSRRSSPGFPDLVLVRAPRVIFAELKRERGRVTAAQREWADELGQCPGVEYYLWRPGD